MTDPLKNRSIREIASGIRDGSTTVEALITGAAANHRKHGEALGAYKHWDEDRALGEARAIAEMMPAP